MKILIAEDDTELAKFVRQSLQEEGHVVDWALDGNQAWLMADAGTYDVIVLDVMMPKLSGLEVLQHLRKSRHAEPILVLTARDSVADKVNGLDFGADDYMTKPFSLLELKARIRALGRRTKSMSPQPLCCNGVRIDPKTHQVFRADREIALTPKEYILLEHLIRNKNQVCTRTEILEKVWDVNFDTYSDVVKVIVSRIRKKLEREGEEAIIQTVRGVGYMMKDRNDEPEV